MTTSKPKSERRTTRERESAVGIGTMFVVVLHDVQASKLWGIKGTCTGPRKGAGREVWGGEERSRPVQELRVFFEDHQHPHPKPHGGKPLTHQASNPVNHHQNKPIESSSRHITDPEDARRQKTEARKHSRARRRTSSTGRSYSDGRGRLDAPVSPLILGGRIYIRFPKWEDAVPRGAIHVRRVGKRCVSGFAKGGAS